MNIVFKNTKLLIGLSVLLVYISISTFSLLQLSHVDEGFTGNCPYTQNSSAVCENSFDHINNWQQFFNVILSPLFFFFAITLTIILYIFNKQNFFIKKLHLFYKWKYYLNNILYSYLNKIIKWLSLFENSPPLNAKYSF